MRPPSASISRTIWPFACPPMAGLHDIQPIVSIDMVSSSVRRPMRAHAHAASHPAWPPPTTITSQTRSIIVRRLYAGAALEPGPEAGDRDAAEGGPGKGEPGLLVERVGRV